MVGGQTMFVLITSPCLMPASSTTLSTLRWKAESGRLVSSSTPVQSLYSLSDHSPSLSASLSL
jgi:hypothetical protein